MASTTPNIGLTLPTGAEKVSRQIINDNNTKIDTAIGTLNSNLGSPSSASSVTGADAFSKINTLNNNTERKGLITTNSNNNFSCTLHNCTGTIVGYPQWQQNANETLTIFGRIVVDSFVRTGSNPGVRLTLPNNTKSKYTITIQNDGYSAGATQGIRIGEHVTMSSSVNDTNVLITVTESYTHFDTATRIWIVIPPITIAIKA